MSTHDNPRYVNAGKVASPTEAMVGYVGEKIAQLDGKTVSDETASYHAGQRAAWAAMYWYLGALIERVASTDSGRHRDAR